MSSSKKSLDTKQKQESKKWQTERVKISNLVARNPKIEKICCICGNPGNILHNRKNPYYIAFICNECKKDKANLDIAETKRFDVISKIGESERYNLGSRYFTDDEVKSIVTKYLNDSVSIGVYCSDLKISRYQFNKLIERYKQLCPSANDSESIETKIKQKSNLVQRKKIKMIKAKNKILTKE